MTLRRAFGAAFVALSAAISGACSLVPAHLERPQLTVVGVGLEHAQFLEQHFRVRIRVDNPNNRALPVRAINFTIELAGERIGGGTSAAPFTVAPRAATEFDALVTTDLATTLLRVLPHLKEGGPPVEYRLAGTVTTDLVLLGTVAFDQRGSFAISPRVP